VSELDIDCQLVERLICDFLRDEIHKVGFTRALVGMSGGLDSSVCAVLAARALGAENTLGVLMPYCTSSQESLEDAQAVAAQVGMETIVVDITPQIDAYFARFPEADARRRGNKMARERMTILYDLSLARQALVVGTSNKTELLLGYTTLWGDMAAALVPIGDLYKTQVRQLARHLGLPERVLSKAPSAELWAGQTDEGELGFTYAEVDRLLYRLVDLRHSPARCVEEGFAPTFVERVVEIMRRSQYKRRLPIVCKLSNRTQDRDFRYPRDWGY
jgi:NAD+ synthase